MREGDSSKKEQLAEMFGGQVSEAPREAARSRSEMDKLLREVGNSFERQSKELARVREKFDSRSLAVRKEQKELMERIERKRVEVNRGLEELHRVLGKHEEKTRYKDETEREIEALDEIRAMLRSKLRSIIGRLEKLKVRKGANLAKLHSEAAELEEEVERSGEEMLDFEREYTKFLGMVGKLSG